ncbi:MAG: prepilin peptidase [Planctomycetaceae bacterium]|jgi:prepilin signal peptidase PulO-like enzyme (type II secretory pathway)|nr:prepilin peptidase [Planctomycetaceae bacterium]
MASSSVFCVILVIVVGCCIGSFLNVVIYRLPIGKSLSYPPSHCPKCKSPIRPYDNFPVFGWFLLRGRCRDCREPISPRYPFVEAVSGMIAGSVSGAVFYANEGESHFDLVIISLYYFGLIVTLFAAGLMEFDRNKIPVKLFIPVTISTPLMLFYLNNINFHTMLNGTNLLYSIASTQFSIFINFFSLSYFAEPVISKGRRTRIKQIRSTQIFIPFLTALTLGLGCGLIAVPILFLAIVLAMLFLRYRKSRRMYLILTCAVWVTIVYILAKF